MSSLYTSHSFMSCIEFAKRHLDPMSSGGYVINKVKLYNGMFRYDLDLVHNCVDMHDHWDYSEESEKLITIDDAGQQYMTGPFIYLDDPFEFNFMDYLKEAAHHVIVECKPITLVSTYVLDHDHAANCFDTYSINDPCNHDRTIGTVLVVRLDEE